MRAGGDAVSSQAVFAYVLGGGLVLVLVLGVLGVLGVLVELWGERRGR